MQIPATKAEKKTPFFSQREHTLLFATCIPYNHLHMPLSNMACIYLKLICTISVNHYFCKWQCLTNYGDSVHQITCPILYRHYTKLRFCRYVNVMAIALYIVSNLDTKIKCARPWLMPSICRTSTTLLL